MPKPYSFDPPSSTPCKLAFVGEAPGDSEIAFGRPLVGPSGQLFNQMLRTAGIKRSEHLITNVFDFKLRENDIASICGGKIDRDEWHELGSYNLPPVQFKPRTLFLKPEYEDQLDRLAAEIERFSPDVIVPLGGTALWAFTGFGGIMARRGTVHEATMTIPGAKLVPTLHPAFVLRSYKYYVVCVQDYMKAMAETRVKGFQFPKREIWIEPTLDDIREFKAKHLDGAEYISCDIETGWGQVTCIGFAPSPNIALVIPLADLDTLRRSYWPTLEHEVEAIALIRDILELPCPKVFQNGTYDTQWIYAKLGIIVRNYSEDTRLQHHAMYPQLPKDLGFLGSVYANQHAWKLMRQGKTNKREE